MALLVVGVAGFFWPGIPMYDTVSQYDQVLSGDVTDWHPPVMVRLWQLLHPLAPGTTPMFILQVALYAVGAGLFVAALARAGRNWGAFAAALLALSPLLFGWQMVVLKDSQMQAALVAAVGIVGSYRLTGRQIPPIAGAVAISLLVYATLVRANAAFATVPLAVVLLQPRPRILVTSFGSMAAIGALLATSPAIGHRLLGASDSGVAKSQPFFDLAAIAVATPPAAQSPFSRAERLEMIERHCVKAFFWDPLGDPTACGPITDRFEDVSERDLYLDLARAAVSHPVAYAEHRLEHWNSTERWLVSPGLTDAGPPDQAEPNDLGLRSTPGPVMPAWQSIAATEAATPLGWPIVWTMLGLVLLPVAWRRRDEPASHLALALLASALALEASFFVISIASDVRYHLWPMLAAPLGSILLADRRPSRNIAAVGTAVFVLVIAGGIVSRAVLPEAPENYEAMIHWPYG